VDNSVVNQTRVRMIVNADDFGYFDEVSRGILAAAEQGVVTATGVMANGPALERWIDKLKATPALSVGVHLNVTLGAPLTQQMSQRLAATGGEFRSKTVFLSSVFSGQMPVAAVIEEWRAQIRHCVQRGLGVQFLNSHEHVHMLPNLYNKVRGLADEFGIRHVRAPQPELGPRVTISGLLRSAVFVAARGLASGPSEPVLIGVAPSGRLDAAYCEWRLSRLAAGATYELMCHPGWSDRAAHRHPKLRVYHDWEGELQTLMSPVFMQLLSRNCIALASYADLKSS
jgi:predicted glycoside hydrolase/deacetylase ChbG (UPF0249 family)